MMIRIIIVTALLYSSFLFSAQGKDYKASLFGIKSDGITLNTGSIQTAIDFISEEGGGRLVFYVGRYLTGSVELRSNVSIHLEEGAVLVGVPSIYDYYADGEFRAILYGAGLNNISITGKGVIMGNGRSLIKSRDEQKKHGYLPQNLKDVLPGLVQFVNCDSVSIKGIILMDSGGDVVSVYGCNQINMDGLTIKNNSLPGYGLAMSKNKDLTLSDSYFETGGQELKFIGENHQLRIVNTINQSGKALRKP